MIKKIECKSTKFSLNSQRFAEKLCINMGVNGSKQKTVFRNVVPLLLQGDGGFSGVQRKTFLSARKKYFECSLENGRL